MSAYLEMSFGRVSTGCRKRKLQNVYMFSFFFWNFFQRFEILKRLETNFYSTLDNFLLLVKFKIVFLREIKEKKKKLYASRNLINFFFSLILDY